VAGKRNTEGAASVDFVALSLLLSRISGLYWTGAPPRLRTVELPKRWGRRKGGVSRLPPHGHELVPWATR
jgi:hypothetical protein